MTHTGVRRGANRILVAKFEGKRLLARPWHRWEGVHWIGVAQDRDKYSSCEHGDEHLGSIKNGEFIDICLTCTLNPKHALHIPSIKQVLLSFSYSEYETSTFTWNCTVLQQFTNPLTTFSERNIA